MSSSVGVPPAASPPKEHRSNWARAQNAYKDFLTLRNLPDHGHTEASLYGAINALFTALADDAQDQGMTTGSEARNAFLLVHPQERITQATAEELSYEIGNHWSTTSARASTEPTEEASGSIPLGSQGSTLEQDYCSAYPSPSPIPDTNPIASIDLLVKEQPEAIQRPELEPSRITCIPDFVLYKKSTDPGTTGLQEEVVLLVESYAIIRKETVRKVSSVSIVGEDWLWIDWEAEPGTAATVDLSWDTLDEKRRSGREPLWCEEDANGDGLLNKRFLELWSNLLGEFSFAPVDFHL
ncbi:hypothetical protein D9756_009709 [Leucocoprinus leucothites]|uniref:Uncharacterized protein n=1 Tax=Leucocoprinus leucothites TaxID=201217 RepID=A0A8H5FU58_9AGAR|nr:hypothetical protein D9756_009709 [Leucoagaricus leucothites]